MAVIHHIDFTPVVGHLTTSELFETCYTAWVADDHTGETRDTFACALLLPFINVGKGVALPYASMSPAEVARHCLAALLTTKYAADRDV